MFWRHLVAALIASPVCVVGAQQRTFSSSDVADAAERLSGHRSHMSQDIRLLSGQRLAGPAITLRLVRDDQASLMAEGLKAIKVLEDAAAGSVIVVCLDGEKDLAVFGPTFATLAKARHLGGFVVDGAMRGVADLKRIGVPVFARGTVAGSAGGHYRLDGVNERVTCGGADVSPGDMIVGDEDGIAVAPQASTAEVLVKAQALRDEKEAMLPLIAKYRSYTKASEEYRRQHAAKAPPARRPPLSGRDDR